MDYILTEIDKNPAHYSKLKGPWIIANIDTWVGWPERRTIVHYKEAEIYLFPDEDDLYPCIGVRHNLKNYDQGRQIIISFISELAWVEQKRISVVLWGGGGHPSRLMKSSKMILKSPHFRITYLPNVENKETRLALAFYREALGLDNNAYSFLSYFKIINLLYKNKKSQKAWIKNNYQKVDDTEAKKRIDELLKNKISIEDYLYHSCRCAIAHASITDTTVDPENQDDILRLKNDLPIIKNLTEILIENELHVKRRHTIWKEHKYEVMGFKEIIGEDVVAKLLNDEEVSEISLPSEICLRIWDKENYIPFEGMKINSAQLKEGNILIRLLSADSLVSFDFKLDFPNERLVVDPLNEIKTKDDKSSVAAINIAEIYRFLSDYFKNGSIVVWDKSENKCLSYLGAFIPVNIDLSKTIESFDTQFKKYNNLAEIRLKNIK